jgi:hypothetical protein
MMLSEKTQAWKDKYCWIPFLEVPSVAIFVQSRVMVARGWVEEKEGVAD